MSRIIKPNFAVANTRTENLIQRMARFDLHDRLELIGNEFDRMGFRTGFSLADQVLTHALLTSQANVEFVIDLDASKQPAVMNSLCEITRETYGLDLKNRLSKGIEAVLVSGIVDKYIAKDKVHNLLTINPLADWNARDLIDYVLAHEVPVDPADIAALQPELKTQAA